MAVTRSTGVVEKIEFTHGGMGNQWTTISGVRYCTFWDIRTADWKEGDTVTFVDVTEPIFGNTPCVRQARDIHKAAAPVELVNTARAPEGEPEDTSTVVSRAKAIEIVSQLAAQWRDQADVAPPERAEALREKAYEMEREFGIATRTVALYEVDQGYGGPEEGGWWYDEGTRFTDFAPIVCHGPEETRAAHAKCLEYIAEHRMNEGRHEPSSVLCEGWYAPRSFPGDLASLPEHFPASRPRYA